MIDYLFISPLGWSKHVWDEIIIDRRFESKSIEIIEFLNDSFEDISEEHIDRKINNHLDNLSKEGVVVASSYGTVALISFLINNNVSINRLILIDGFDIVPSLEELNSTFNCVEDKCFQEPSDYYNDVLSDDEKMI